MDVRQPAFAGSWYPDTAAACEREIRELTAGQGAWDGGGVVLGGIVPHAGWFFSGRIAARVVQALAREVRPDAVVIFGMHLHPGAQPVIMTRGAWGTPLGNLPIAVDLARELLRRLRFDTEDPGDHNRDNTIELQLPFVRHFLGPVPILPIGVPPAPLALEIADALADAAQEAGLRLQVIGSTDLTHYGPNYGWTSRGLGAKAVGWVKADNDRRMVDAILALDPRRVIQEGLSHRNACCAGAAAAALQTAKRLGATSGDLLAYTTSYDKQPGDSFVGYAGIVLAG
jgi:AmmeMemoRadiSam system protein B